ncbi:tail fiber protein [Nostoc sp. FACHB-152]|uniref:phage tail protein n=1 Tax=Nostoc sp. FACHB-152 TaxID=2692837 RepID=UPI001687C9B9|nr:tail fiber protein [Nostoc sp. FACHB-152]MBD2449416.1 tail fiber protein [Nostoc sp. FACHB-152]
MTRRVFQDGDILYAQDVNEIGNPIVDGQDLLGHGPKVTDAYLSDSSNQLKSRFYNFYDRLKVSQQTGLTFSYLGGVVLLSNGTLASISPGTINLPNNATSFVFVGSNGTVQQSSVLPNECFPLALITTTSGTLSTLVDLRDKVIDRVAPSTIPVQQLIPPGFVGEYWGNTAPSGWLWCDGATYSQATYPALYAALGSSYNVGGGNFRVPDHRGRVAVGAGQGSGLTNRTLGQTFGSETVTLDVSQLPSHNHGVNDPGHSHPFSDPGHSHGVNDPGHGHGLPGDVYDREASEGSDGSGSAYQPRGAYTLGATTGISIRTSWTGINISGASTGLSINSQGGGGSHNNIQPSVVCNFIIKV